MEISELENNLEENVAPFQIIQIELWKMIVKVIELFLFQKQS